MLKEKFWGRRFDERADLNKPNRGGLKLPGSPFLASLISADRLDRGPQLAPFLVVIALLVIVAILNAVGISTSHHTITGGAAWLNILWVVALLVGSAALFAYNIVMAVLVFLGRR